MMAGRKNRKYSSAAAEHDAVLDQMHFLSAEWCSREAAHRAVRDDNGSVTCEIYEFAGISHTGHKRHILKATGKEVKI